VTSERKHSPSAARLSSWSRLQAHSELSHKLTAGELDPKSKGDPAATTLFAFVSVLVARAGADGEAWYGQEELREAIRAKDRRTICRVVAKARELELFWTRPFGYANRSCSTYVLELGRRDPAADRIASVEVLRQTEKRTSLRPESAAAAVVLGAYDRAMVARWEVSSSLEPTAPVLEPVSAFFAAAAAELGTELGFAADAGMATYTALRGMSDGALEKRCHPIEWVLKYKTEIKRGIRAELERSRARSSRPKALADCGLAVPIFEARELAARIASGNFAAAATSTAARLVDEGKRVASAGSAVRPSVSALG
jgi:hypothetical protein